MCSQNQNVSATSSSALAQVLATTQLESSVSNLLANKQQQQKHQQHNDNSQQHNHHHHHHHHHHHSPSLTCGVGSSLLDAGLGGSTMLSPPLSGNPFNSQSAYDWLSTSSSSLSAKHNSIALEKRLNIENILQNCSSSSKHDTCSTEKNKNSSSCRFNQKIGQQNSDPYNLMTMFNLGINADTVLARSSSHNFADVSSLLHQQQKQQHHQQQQQQKQHQQHSNHHQQQHTSSACSASAVAAATAAAVAATAGSQLYNSHFSSSTAAAAAAVAAAATASTPYHLQQGHGLPSPTIYPPTPPPSAPWIHPWYPGDTF